MSHGDDIDSVVYAVQLGNFDLVRDAIRDRVVSINDVDESGCTFLHWAAINNRIQIARFLIDSGISGHRGGGILCESPLQWAIRKRFYAMADLIFHRTHCDLSHRSSDGSDALHIACKLGFDKFE
jgi:ankyrin repeat protein